MGHRPDPLLTLQQDVLWAVLGTGVSSQSCGNKVSIGCTGAERDQREIALSAPWALQVWDPGPKPSPPGGFLSPEPFRVPFPALSTHWAGAREIHHPKTGSRMLTQGMSCRHQPGHSLGMGWRSCSVPDTSREHSWRKAGLNPWAQEWAASWRGLVRCDANANTPGFGPQHPRTVACGWHKDGSLRSSRLGSAPCWGFLVKKQMGRATPRKPFARPWGDRGRCEGSGEDEEGVGTSVCLGEGRATGASTSQRAASDMGDTQHR